MAPGPKRMRRVLIAAFAAVLLIAWPTAASARDAYWHGKRGPVWDHGPDRSRDLSNWYTKSPNRGGRMTRPPDELAIFAEGARERDVWIVKRPDDAFDVSTRIGSIVILRNAPSYAFLIKSRAALNLNGQGLLTRSDNAPRFVLESGGKMILAGAARLNSSTGQTSAAIEVGQSGLLRFEAFSRGGAAQVSNAGAVQFRDESSAETMDVTVLSAVSSAAPILQFYGRSNPDRAKFRVLAGGIVNFGSTAGPEGSGRITSGSIVNSGSVLVGTNTLTVVGRYEHPDRLGSLTVQARGRRVGDVFVRGGAKVGGALYVTLPQPGQTLPPGVYRILYARDGVEGRFETLGPSFSNWRLEHLANEVRLIVD
jgi:hypothetical protein